MASKEKEERVNELTEINIKLDVFEGPLDLLLHLIQQMEIDIYDIPIATITEQYMNYIHTMKTLELAVAGEYLVMAATLMAIKSKTLLPVQEFLHKGQCLLCMEDLLSLLLRNKGFSLHPYQIQQMA